MHAPPSSSRRTMCLHSSRVRPAHHIHTPPRAIQAGKVSNASARSGKVVFEDAVLWCVAMTARPRWRQRSFPGAPIQPHTQPTPHVHTALPHTFTTIADFTIGTTPPPKATACMRARQPHARARVPSLLALSLTHPPRPPATPPPAPNAGPSSTQLNCCFLCTHVCIWAPRVHVRRRRTSLAVMVKAG